MTATKQLKGLLAGVAAVALIGTAMAQGNPPNPAVKSAPIGAGQQSSQKTPMGETGTPNGSPATAGAGASTSTNMGSASTSSAASMGSTSSSADTTMASDSGGTRHAKRRMRADRN